MAPHGFSFAEFRLSVAALALILRRLWEAPGLELRGREAPQPDSGAPSARGCRSVQGRKASAFGGLEGLRPKDLVMKASRQTGSSSQKCAKIACALRGLT